MNVNDKIELLSDKNKALIKKHPFITGFVILIVIIFFINTVSNFSSGIPEQVTNPTTKQEQPVPQKQAVPTVSKEQAQKELDDLMDTAKKAGLVTSYEFSDKATEVFIGSIWYTQTVQFKKDFIAKIGMLKKAITGYTHFEVKDAYSNEKVGEITAFSQSIEVYK